MDDGPDWLTKPTLRGRRVLLRPFGEQDIPAMAEALADPEVLKLTGSVHGREETRRRPPEPDDELLAWYRSRGTADGRLDLAIVDLPTGNCVGEAVLNDYDPGNASCNFRTLIGPRGRDRGLGTEATRLIVGYGLTVLGLHRIELMVYAFNPRARRVYEKAGFRVEGTARDALRFDDGWVDAIYMSILSTD
ncbi:MAG TPA: GNAT family protein [Streptosporangiaceae bacterium]|nr:GNAT family protein [Streptosporangiaceae bacterium]